MKLITATLLYVILGNCFRVSTNNTLQNMLSIDAKKSPFKAIHKKIQVQNVELERTRLARELHDGLSSMLGGIKHFFSSIQNNIA